MLFNNLLTIHVYISKTCYGFLLTLCWSCWLISFSKCQIPYITQSTMIWKIRSISINDGLALKPLLLISFSLVLVIVLFLKVGFHYYMFYIKKYLPENEFSTKHKVQFQKLKGKPQWDWNMLSASNFCCHNQRNNIYNKWLYFITLICLMNFVDGL